MFKQETFLILAVIACFSNLVKAECQHDKYKHVPTILYDDLRCTPKYSFLDENCPIIYDCSHIYDRPNGTCHFQGKAYNINDKIDFEELIGVEAIDCSCSESEEFVCPPLIDGCAEGWVGGYPKPTCYLRYELNNYCAAGEICPPFDGNAICEVAGITYQEGNKFKHPHKKCEECVCNKGFNLEAPFCRQVNCTEELKQSKMIDNYCAPFYKSGEAACCPDSWICPSDNGEYYANPSPSPDDDPNLQCHFGSKMMSVGDYYQYNDQTLGKIHCECGIPPLLYCTNNI